MIDERDLGAVAPVRFATDLAAHGDRPAIVVDGTTVTYAELEWRVEALARELGPVRRLTLLRANRDVATIVAYLAALRAGHPLLLVPDGVDTAELTGRYRPEAAIDEERVSILADGPVTALHPELALCLSTSGSTGAPKLVRLSGRNLDANTGSIVEYLGLRCDDRAALTLPLHYCYGLSVLNTHLAVGGSLLLTQRSLADPALWDEVREAGVTMLAGVPHTFELLHRNGFADAEIPTLRTVTQAGGRLAPELVRRFAHLGERRGWRFFVMYGQTEATARMAYLPPALAGAHPTAIGVPIPGGELDVEPLHDADDDGDDDGVGELVYRGPNVMLGYATTRDDLALGRTVRALRTGDVARRLPNGLFEVIGRRSRFIKPFGVRVDLDRVESILRHDGIDTVCTGDDHGLVVAVEPGGDAARAEALIRLRVTLPASALSVAAVRVPRLASGKPDYNATAEAVRAATTPHRDVRAVFAAAFPHAEIDDTATFVGLGGDSLSYVEVSLGLEEALGALPDDWQALPLATLEARRTRRPLRLRRVETTVALRAAAIVVVVATHAGVVDVRGGAHLLLAVAGYNFVRFHLAGGPVRVLRPVARLAVPAMAWVAVLLATTDDYRLTNLLLVHGHVGPTRWDQTWRYWYVEAIVQVLLVAGAALAVPSLRRLERARPLAFAAGVLCAGLVVRTVLVDVLGFDHRGHRTATVFWIFALGWVAARASTAGSRAVLSVVAVVAARTFYGMYDDPVRELWFAGGFLVLVWVPSVRLPRPVAAASGMLASASLYTYLTHWQVYPAVRDATSPIVAVAASLVVGYAAWRAVRLAGWARRALRPGTSASPSPTAAPRPRRARAPR